MEVCDGAEAAASDLKFSSRSPFVAGDDDCDDSCSDSSRSNGGQCLEKYVLLNEIRADALREAGLYDDYIRLCQRALQQVGTFGVHNRVFDSFTMLACDDRFGQRVTGLRNAAAFERLRPAIESAAMDDYEAQSGVRPHSATAVNVRSACCDGIWQAVAIDGGDESRVWYRVEFAEDDEFDCVCLDGDLEMDDRFSIIQDMSRITER
jgi:hypothetical protein